MSADALAEMEVAYRALFRGEPSRASVSFVGVEPIEVLRFEGGLTCTYVTLGMSRHPMVPADASIVDSAAGPRAELLLTTVGPADAVWRQLAVLAAAPAVQSTVYVVGDRVGIETALIPGSRCVGGLIVASGLGPVPVDGLDEVDLLRLLPATSDELAWARVHGNDALQQRWAEAGTDLQDLGRSPVSLL